MFEGLIKLASKRGYEIMFSYEDGMIGCALLNEEGDAEYYCCGSDTFDTIVSVGYYLNNKAEMKKEFDLIFEASNN